MYYNLNYACKIAIFSKLSPFSPMDFYILSLLPNSFFNLLIFSYTKKTVSYFHRQKSYIKFNRYNAHFFFKYLTFFKLKNHKLNSSSSTFPTKLKNDPWIELFILIRFNLKPKKHPLIGTKVPLIATDFRRMKKWMAQRPHYFIKRSRRWYKFNRQKKKKNLFFRSFFRSTQPSVLPTTKKLRKKYRALKKLPMPSIYENTFKTFYFNKLFFFFKLKLSYRNLRYKLRRLRLVYPQNWTRFKFKKPYKFLNNPKLTPNNVIPPIVKLYTKFRFYKKILKTFRRIHYRKKKASFHYFKKISRFLNIFRISKKKRFKFPYVKRLNFFKLTPLLFVPKFQNTSSFKTNALKISFNCTHLPFYVRSLFSFKKTLRKQNFVSFRLKRKKVFRIKPRRFFRFKLRLSPYIRIRKFFKKKRVIRWKKLIRLSELLSKFKLFKGRKLLQLPSVLVKTQHKPYKQLPIQANHYLKNLIFRRPSKFSLKLVTRNKIKTRLYLNPDRGLRFYLPTRGFLALTNILPLSYMAVYQPYMYRFRRLKYSFSFRDDLPKHILNKYSYNRVNLKRKRFFKIKQSLSHPTLKPSLDTQFSIKHNNLVCNNLIITSNLEGSLYPFFNNSSFEVNRFYFQNTNITHHTHFTIKQIKFKPGYMRIWRRARKALQIRTKTYFRYQHQLTHFLITFRKIAHLQSATLDELKLRNILMRSRIVLDLATADAFIHHNIVAVNGFFCTNPVSHVCKNDFIQLIISFKYYITFRWLLNKALQLKGRIKHLSKKINKEFKAQNPDKNYNQKKPLWISPHLHLFLDIAKYMEVDFFTLSIFMLHDPFLWLDTNPYHDTIIKPRIYNMYNWKYIT